MKPYLVRTLLFLSLTSLLAACDNGGGDTDAGTTPDGSAATGDGGGGADGGGADGSASSNTIADIAAGNPDFSILVAAASRAGLVDTLAGDGPYTVFAPTDAAFEASGIAASDIDSMDVATLTDILKYHVVSGAVRSTDLSDGPVDTVATASGGWNLDVIVGTTGGVTLNGGNTVTGGANVTMADIEADNGIIHVIDRVLLPPDIPTMATYAGLSDLVDAVTTAGLDTALAGAGPFTVFAPTNDAFPDGSDRPTGDALVTVLSYHVLTSAVPSDSVPARADALATNAAGNNLTLLFDTSSGVAVNGIDVAIADVGCTNGIVHVIGGVLLPPTVIDMAGIAGLTSLADAIATADGGGASIAATLSGDAPSSATGFTVFAPTNDAFDAISSTVAGLSADQVANVLTYHVLDPSMYADPVLSTDLTSGDVTMLNGDTATVDTSASPPTIADQAVVPDLLDINVTNGVIHVLSGVMIPPSL